MKKTHSASMSKQVSKIIKDTQEKMAIRKKNLTENFQVSNERLIELEFKAIKREITNDRN